MLGARRTVLALARLALPLAALGLGSAAAQETAESYKHLVPLFQYLKRDIFITEGVGLKRIRLGQPFETVRRLLGRPARARDDGLLGMRHWYYRAEGPTEIRLSGKRVIERIRFRGTPASPYQTAAGARFGMPVYQVAALYGGSGSVHTETRLEYPARGIRFYFAHGELVAFEVYAPYRLAPQSD